MGKIVHFGTFQRIKDAAARAGARQASPLAKLDQRVADMDSAYHARTQPARKGVWRKPRRYRQPRRQTWNPSGTTILSLGLLALAAFWFVPDAVDMRLAAWTSPGVAANDSQSASFGLCHSGGGTNCVVDGDTIWYQGNKIRIADIDTPETHPPRCAEEARLGAAATQRLQGLLNAGTFSIESIDRDTDRYGRQLRVLSRNGESIGGMLVDDGLARWYGSGRQSWC
jgi:micrococcal nuclease